MNEAIKQDYSGNQQFWNGLNGRSPSIQLDFIEGSEMLSLALGEQEYGEIMHKTLTLDSSTFEDRLQTNFNLSEPPDGASWIEELKYSLRLKNAVDTQLTMDMSNNVNKKIDENIEDIKHIFGFIDGDFNKDPSVSQVIVGGLISMIPVVDQVCDVRDLIANVIILSDEENRTNKDNWMNLAFTGVGIIPGLGSFFKTIAKLITNKAIKTTDGLLSALEELESYARKMNIKPYWGDNPLKWIKEKPWLGIADKAKTALGEMLDKLARLLSAYGTSNTVKVIGFDTLVDSLSRSVRAIMSKIDSYIDELCDNVQILCDEILHNKPMLASANYMPSQHPKSINNGGNGSIASHKQSGDLPSLKRMNKKDVGCFKRTNTKSAHSNAQTNMDNNHPLGRNASSTDDFLDKEMSKQLQSQQDAINSMTTEEFKKGRDLFKQKGRGSAANQIKARNKYERDLHTRYMKESDGIGAKIFSLRHAEATEATKSVMKSLAALHDPDNIAGYQGLGTKKTLNMGLKNVNSSIGNQWNNKAVDETVSRVTSIDNAVDKIPDSELATTKMNVKLKVCK